MIGAVIGIALGILVIAFARVTRGEGRLYALGLLTLPSLYALFALHAGDQGAAIRELLYGLPYLAAGLTFAFVGMRHSAVIVGVFWILHGLYDLVHSQLITNPGVPRWYPLFCFAVDIVIGAYLLWLSRRISSANLRMA